MRLKDKIKIRRFKKYWKKQGRKDMFSLVHRYLRLHNELLTDSVYQNMYNYHRNTLIAYLRIDLNNKMSTDAKLGELVDVMADFFNKHTAQQVNKYKPLVDELYKYWSKSTIDI